MTKMMPLAGAVQLATVLITANAAWCQSSDSSSVLNYTTSTINRFDDRLGLKSTVPMRVRETKVGAWDAVKAGFLMAVAREPFSNVWPSYTYKTDPSSACKFLTDGMAEDAFILASRVELGAAAHRDSDSLEVNRILASNICNTETDNPGLSPEPNIWAWQGKQDTYYYIMADIPVPSLELSARVWREELNIYDYFITDASHDP